MEIPANIEVRKGWKSGKGDDKTILVLDEAEGAEHSLVDLLGDEGYGVIAVSDPEAALKVLDVVKVSMVALDLSFLCEEALFVLERLRRSEHASDTPVLILSRENASPGAESLIATSSPKPLDPDRVLSKVESIIGKA